MQRIVTGSVLAFVCITVYPYKLGIQNIPYSLRQKCSASSIALLTDEKAFDILGSSSETYLENKGMCCTRVFSVYDVALHPITPECLASIDILLVDIADFGMRTTPSIRALVNSLYCAASSGTHVIILDRPNPFGYRMEGSLTSFDSESGYLPVPLRHGMTAGELAWFCNMHCLARPAHLHVVQMSGYDREHDYWLQNNASSLFTLLNHVSPLSYKHDVLYVPVCGSQADWNVFSDSMRSCGITASVDRLSHGITCSLSVDNPSSVAIFKAIGYIIDFLRAQSIDVRVDSVLKACSGNQVNDALIQFFGKAKSSFMYAPVPLISVS
jgi:hypothetical protein